MDRQKIITLRGKEYRIRALYNADDKRYYWEADRNNYGIWVKIPCWTHYEERHFPKTLGFLANDFVKECNKVAY